MLSLTNKNIGCIAANLGRGGKGPLLVQGRSQKKHGANCQSIRAFFFD